MQLTVEPSKGGHWDPPKTDTPHPRTREKLQEDGRRGTIMIKNQIPYPPGG